MVKIETAKQLMTYGCHQMLIGSYSSNSTFDKFMAQLDRLIRDARAAMQSRGHTPAPARRSMGKGAAIIKCSTCDKEVHILCKPQPNEVQIGGEAVAMSCNVATQNNLRDVLLTIPADNEISMEAVFGC